MIHEICKKDSLKKNPTALQSLWFWKDIFRIRLFLRHREAAPHWKQQKRIQGSALILTLLALSALGILAASAATMGLYLVAEEENLMKQSRSFYAAESAVNRVLFYLREDNRTHPVRTLGENEYHGINDFYADAERWLADGIDREVSVSTAGTNSETKQMFVRVTDEAGAFQIQPVSTLMQRLIERRQAVNEDKGTDLSETQLQDRVTDRITDFFDADSQRTVDGMEKEEFLAINRPFLPQNRDPEFREELFDIPGFIYFVSLNVSDVSAFFQLIPPSGMASIPQIDSIYSSDLDSLAAAADLTDDEKKDFSEALALWRKDQTLLSKSLKDSLLEKVQENLSNTESGFYRVRIEPADGEPGVKLDAVFRLQSTSIYAFEFYEYFTH